MIRTMEPELGEEELLKELTRIEKEELAKMAAARAEVSRVMTGNYLFLSIFVVTSDYKEGLIFDCFHHMFSWWFASFPLCSWLH